MTEREIVEDDENVLLDENGNPFSPIRVWKTKNGVILPISIISDAHLENIIKLLERRNQKNTDAYKTMIHEKKRRVSTRDVPDFAKPVFVFDLKKSYPSIASSMSTTPSASSTISTNINRAPEEIKREITSEREERIIVEDITVHVFVGDGEGTTIIKDMIADEKYTMEEIMKKATEIGVQVEIPASSAVTRYIDELIAAKDERDDILTAFDKANVSSDEFSDSIIKLKNGDESGVKTILNVACFLKYIEHRRK